jgi:predicted naringenin-chalcone synthase
MIAAFREQRLAAGDVSCDFEFASRVMRACRFKSHSVALPLEDVFRRMSRSEYLARRHTDLLELALRAAGAALVQWGGRRSSITHLFFGTMTGAMQSPSLDIHIAKRLGLDSDVQRMNAEGMGCLTGFRLLNLARQVTADASARVLVVTADLRSAVGNSLPERATRADIVSACLFRDGASALVLGGGGLAAGEHSYFEVVCGRSRIVEGTEHLGARAARHPPPAHPRPPPWPDGVAGDFTEREGGTLQLFLAKELPDAVAAAEPAFVQALLSDAARCGAAPPPVAELSVACHTGGPRVLERVASALGASEAQLASRFAPPHSRRPRRPCHRARAPPVGPSRARTGT